MIKTIISILNKIILQFKKNNKDNYSGNFFLVRIKKEKGNIINLTKGNFKKTFIEISGYGNSIKSTNGLIEHSQIAISGQNNTLYIAENVKLRQANIIIRGSDCNITIGKSTTFGGVRIVNVGKENNVKIGKDCLFSDHIEIWASDTHSIFNSKNEKINKELPVYIGDKVWVGSRVTILKGTKINDGAIIGMGTIVSKDIPKKTISVGVPNKVIKENVHWSLEY
ncbi:acyltransferase [Maribacter sp. Asnod1-A12]|uniref:acyltransferase n=1 Tax=Maribacter sp. Asnod1-A12 TaxID=3160576 RepID=UPI00386DAAA2